jgi:hypothetical protein
MYPWFHAFWWVFTNEFLPLCCRSGFPEVVAASSWIVSLLVEACPLIGEGRFALFGRHLTAILMDRYPRSWDSREPWRGSNWRILRNTLKSLDPDMARAADRSGLLWAFVLRNLPPNLSLSIDPGRVVARYGSDKTEFVDFTRPGRPAF